MGKEGARLEEQWWQDNWEGVVDTYWDKCSNLIIAKMKNPEMSLRLLSYHMNLDRNRKIVRDRARKKKMTMIMMTVTMIRDVVEDVADHLTIKKMMID